MSTMRRPRVGALRSSMAAVNKFIHKQQGTIHTLMTLGSGAGFGYFSYGDGPEGTGKIKEFFVWKVLAGVVGGAAAGFLTSMLG